MIALLVLIGIGAGFEKKLLMKNVDAVPNDSGSQMQRSLKICFFCELKMFLTRSKPEDKASIKSKSHKIYALLILGHIFL